MYFPSLKNSGHVLQISKSLKVKNITKHSPQSLMQNRVAPFWGVKKHNLVVTSSDKFKIKK